MYDNENYKDIFQKALKARPQNGRGQRAKLAQYLQCQPTYISHVLAGSLDFTLEHAEKTCRYLAFTEAETTYLLHLVGRDRAGTIGLKQFYQSKIDEIRSRENEVKQQVAISEQISNLDRAEYYKSWHYAAIHILVTIPKFGSVDDIAEALSLAPQIVANVVEFLVRAGLIKHNGKIFEATSTVVHLERHYPEINAHHNNLRLKAMDAISSPRDENLHFSTMLTCSHGDFAALKTKLLACIKDCAETIKASESEKLGAINIDLFSIL